MIEVFKSDTALITCVEEESGRFRLLWTDRKGDLQVRSRETFVDCASAKRAFEAHELMPGRDWEPVIVGG
jgi:hypothetical protein